MGATLERELGTGPAVAAAARARCALLARCAHPGILNPERIEERVDGTVVAVVPVVDGASLAELTKERRLTLGECVTVAVGAAQALAVLHNAGLAHGDISPANIVALRTSVTLVDTLGAPSVDTWTQGFAAPERHHGATAAADVYALAAVLRCVVDDAGAPAVEAWTAPMMRAEPGERPHAAHVEAAFAVCSPAVPIHSLEQPVVAAMRAASAPRTVRRPQDRWWRAERAAVRVAPLAALAAVALLPAQALTQTASALLPADASRDEPVVVAEASLLTPEQAAVALTHARVQALESEDARALRGISTLGSAAAAADSATAAAMSSGTLAVDGLRLDAVEATLTRRTPAGALVRVTTTMSAHTVTRGDHTVQIPATTAVAVIEMRLSREGWSVTRVQPAR
jgi:tRNA A-37 threonylcarbamoyl transferase component Bud32